MVICPDLEWMDKLQEYLAPVLFVFSDHVQQVSAWYLFRMSEQAYVTEFEDTATADAIHWYMETKDKNEAIHAIGVSVEALENGRKYAQLLILHELAHMITNNNHTIRFHEVLSGLINQFNDATGSNIENDYFGIETRNDSRPWMLPDDIPQQQSQRGNQFRTEAKA